MVTEATEPGSQKIERQRKRARETATDALYPRRKQELLLSSHVVCVSMFTACKAAHSSHADRLLLIVWPDGSLPPLAARKSWRKASSQPFVVRELRPGCVT